MQRCCDLEDFSTHQHRISVILVGCCKRGAHTGGLHTGDAKGMHERVDTRGVHERTVEHTRGGQREGHTAARGGALERGRHTGARRENRGTLE